MRTFPPRWRTVRILFRDYSILVVITDITEDKMICNFRSIGWSYCRHSMLGLCLGLDLPRCYLSDVYRTSGNVQKVYTPKAVNCGYESVKDFRLINLTTFVLKTLECFLQIYSRTIMKTTPNSKSLHFFLKGKPTENAIHKVISTVGR